MRHLKLLALIGVACLFSSTTANAPAQISISIGAPPVCPYGYFDYAPYNCAPYGYYGPDWFTNGVFVGAGPWFHGPEGFWGHVDDRWDPRHGYVGPFPARGERPFWGFHADEARDGRGHMGRAHHDGGMEHRGGFVGRRHGRR